MMKNRMARLHWSTRRGMLELDILLGNFLKEAYPALTPNVQTLFAQLLEENDQDLFLWLTGKEIPLKSEIAIIVNKVREHAITRHHTEAF